jgi:hypothetical protein
MVKNSIARSIGLIPWDNIEGESTYYPMTVLVFEDARDCDGTCYSMLSAIPATQEHLQRYVDNFYESLEGPGKIMLVTIEWALQYLESVENENDY